MIAPVGFTPVYPHFDQKPQASEQPQSYRFYVGFAGQVADNERNQRVSDLANQSARIAPNNTAEIVFGGVFTNKGSRYWSA